MAKTSVRETRRWTRFVPGLVLTTLFAVGIPLADSPINVGEPIIQDWLLWKTQPVTDASPEITVIEIDDLALERIQRWPWSWDKMADIIDALHDLQAQAVVLDIVYNYRPESELNPRNNLADFPQGEPVFKDPVLPSPKADAPVAAPVGILVDPVPVLARAVRDSRSAILAYSFDSKTRVYDPGYAEVEQALVADPTLAAVDVAARIRRSVEEVELFYLTARRRAIEVALARVAPINAEDPQALRAAFATVFPGAAWDAKSALGRDFTAAADHVRREATLIARGALNQSADGWHELPRATRISAPLAELSDAAAGLGFATVFPDPDGVVRRVPLGMVSGDRVFPQLGLCAAMAAQGAHRFTYQRDGDYLVVTGDNGAEARIPVDDQGRMIINWAKGQQGQRGGFRHLQISKLYQYQRLLVSHRAYEDAMAFAAKLFAVADRRAQLVARKAEARRSGAAQAQLEAAAGELTALDDDLAFKLSTLAGQPRPANVSLHDYILAQEYAWYLGHYVQEEADRVERQLNEIREQLREAVQGRLCFVGMTATSAALDLKPTPIHRDYPGVFAHAAIADNILRRDFVHQASTPTRIALLLLLGLLVTLVAGWLPTVPATLASLALMAAYWGLCWLLLTYRGLCVLLAWPWLAAALSLLAIMVFRELTEGRMRRWITDAFKQYNSPEMVDDILANPESLALGGQRRDMTVYFSDIAGFTGLSERLEPPQLNAFLQRYLGRMTDLLYEQKVTLDKYIGDAVVAFAGAPLAQSDHAARCLRAALAHLRALPLLNEQLHAEGILPADTTLRIRIGISSGQMAVGNFGSEQHFSYTVIGDSVNVGARLEGACRMFGATVLVAASTQAQVGDQFLLRRIGPIRFVGKTEAIDVYELLDPDTPGTRDGLDEYHAALKEFEGGWYYEAKQKFEAVLAARPDDGPTRAYLERVDGLLRDGISTPPGPWDQTEK